MSRLLSWTGFLLLLFAAVQFGFEALSALERVGFVLWMYPFLDTGTAWFQTHPQSLQVLQAAIQRYVHPLIWDPGIQWILLQPLFAVIGVTGLFFMVLGRLGKQRKKRHRSKFAT